MFSFNGQSVREKARITMHNLMEFLLRQKDDQSKNLLLISSILHTLCVEGVSAFTTLLSDFHILIKRTNRHVEVTAEFSSAQAEHANKLR